MDNNKISTQLNAALNATESELNNSPELRTGFEPQTRKWELIVRYTGDLFSLTEKFPTIEITQLLFNYAVIKIAESEIDAFSASDEIIFIEKPKRLFFEVNSGKRASCINPVQSSAINLSGHDTIVAVIDSGIDYMHPDFIDENGKTRILLLWDQSLGQFYDSDIINQAINAPSAAIRFQICPSIDLSGHGTHVAGIAAGNGRASSGVYRGIAYEAGLIIVKLAAPAPDGFPSTVELIKAVDFCVREAIARRMPMAINLSFGNTYGAHNGSSLLETYLDNAGSLYKCCIVCGSGNEGASAGHNGGKFSSNGETDIVELSVTEFTPGLTIQLWKDPWDVFEIQIISPQNQSFIIPNVPGSWRYTLGHTQLYITVGDAVPYSIYQEIYIDLNVSDTSASPYIDFGIWTISLKSIDIRYGIWDVWLPSSSVRNASTNFVLPSPDTTLTIPSSAQKIITVGAYDSSNDSFAPFSGRGFTWNTNQVKPDLVAPGVNITSCAPGGGYETRSGTSMATPFVTGSCSLLMQWGIVDGNDAYMYGEKIKAALIRGTRKLPFVTSYPNETVGWGALCLRDSIPI